MSVKVMRLEDDQGHLTFFSNQRHALRRLDGQQSNLQIYLKIFVLRYFQPQIIIHIVDFKFVRFLMSDIFFYSPRCPSSKFRR